MAAPLGYKDFTTGEVLTANDVDGYLMQGIWVFASAAARDAAVTSPQEGNFAFLKDTNVTTYYTGSAWANLDTSGLVNPMTTTGDTIYSSPGSTPQRLGIGTTGQVLTVASGIPSWATPAAGGGMTLINTGGTALSGTSTQVSSIPGTYKSLEIWVVNAQINADTEVTFTINNDTGANQYLHLKLQNQDTTPGTVSQKSSGVYLNASGASYFVKNSTENFTKIVIPNYAASGIHEFKVDFVGKQAGSVYTYMLNGLVYCYNTSAVTSFELRSITTGSFSGGTIYVYGVN